MKKPKFSKGQAVRILSDGYIMEVHEIRDSPEGWIYVLKEADFGPLACTYQESELRALTAREMFGSRPRARRKK